VAEKKKRKKGVRAKHPPLNDHYNPFKRSSRLGPGPMRGRNSETKNWECTWLEPYKQRCVFVGDVPSGGYHRGSKKTIKIDPAYKKTYNKAYWRYLTKNRNKKRHPIFKQNKAQPDYVYRRPDRPVRRRKKKRS
jgi:hypothetical protein